VDLELTHPAAGKFRDPVQQRDGRVNRAASHSPPTALRRPAKLGQLVAVAASSAGVELAN
jgi:hypothetical protein